MGYHSLLRSPKKEEQQVPDTINDTEFVDIKESSSTTTYDANKEMDIMDGLEGIYWGIDRENEENLSRDSSVVQAHHQLSWDFMEWEGFPINGEEEGNNNIFGEESDVSKVDIVKNENNGFVGHDDEDDDDDDEKRVSLNLNLNYQEVLDAWSDRGPPWADDYSLSVASNGYYMGEVPVMEEERTKREASVLRYKEKRQTRLFSKKIRYQVRKLNADKRPRLKGRFVKRVS
ncbi:hypothetical protein JRO89_XS13G0090900 [Xanthoceras sorbifolium]|uniref:CCT domain-containing protein n=1 Tax=Xanthoceras sorbifolium TaxID=99658 RepID=A0ABQ8H7F3_9ROSI|nr:hypothetical protein JRO89_XS13G0090900 [Xanthoceras sorbifolium]